VQAPNAPVKTITIGDFNKTLLSKVLLQLQDVAPGSTVELYIDSPGGQVIVLEQILEALHAKHIKTSCEVGRYAASAAAILLITCDQVKVDGSDLVLFHLPYMPGPNGQKIHDPELTREMVSPYIFKYRLDIILGPDLVRFFTGEDIVLNGIVFNERNHKRVEVLRG